MPQKSERSSLSQRGNPRRVLLWSCDQLANLRRVVRFALRQFAVGVAADAGDPGGEIVLNYPATERLVRLAVVAQAVLVKEMPEWPVPDVVQQSGEPC